MIKFIKIVVKPKNIKGVFKSLYFNYLLKKNVRKDIIYDRLNDTLYILYWDKGKEKYLKFQGQINIYIKKGE